jgi:hypothetical protein
MNKIINKIFLVLGSVIILIVILAKSLNLVMNKMNFSNDKTEIAFSSSMVKSLIGEVLVVRKESVIKNSDEKIVNYLVKDGEKVFNGMPVAQLYDSLEDAQNEDKLHNIQKEIDIINEVISLKNGKNFVSELFSKQISNKVRELIIAENSGILLGKEDIYSDLLMMLNKKSLVYGKLDGLSEKLSLLQNERDAIKTQTNIKDSFIYAKDTGYFVSKADGYEQVSLPDLDVSKLTFDDCLSIFNQKKLSVNNRDYIGKLITNFDWYVILKAGKVNLNNFKGINSVVLDFTGDASNSVPAEIVDIKQSNNKENTIFILKCNYMSKDLSMIRRSAHVKLSTQSYYGIFVNTKAIRFVDNQKGVYIRDGQEVKFKKVDPLIETDKVVVSKILPQDSDYLQIFDEIILEGQNLFDGKLIK